MRDKFTKLFLLLLVPLLTLVGCDKSDDEPNYEYLELIQGEWHSMSHMSDGEAMNDSGLYSQRWVFYEDGTMQFDVYLSEISSSTSPNVALEGTYTIYGNTLTIETSIYYKRYDISNLDELYLDLNYTGTEGGACVSSYQRYQ